MKRILSDIWYSFPVRLFLLHLRSNLLFVALWVVLVLMMSGQLGQRLGLPYLFLDPEYLGKVNGWGFFILGMAFGGFFMSWNLTIYLLSAHHFPFLACLSRPFTKFSVNNSLLPFLFFGFYIGLIIYFQNTYERLSASVIFLNCFSLFAGAVFLVALLALYFQSTNRDISYYKRQEQPPPNLVGSIAPGRRGIDLDYIKQDENRLKVLVYLTESLRPKLVRSVAHYESYLLMNIFKQNHLNALILQLLTMMLLLLLGYLIDYSFFRIPAGASIFILFSIITAIVGAITYWFDEWRAMIFIGFLVVLNYFTSFTVFNHTNRAYGLPYDNHPADYSLGHFQQILTSGAVDTDIVQTKHTLDKWHNRVTNGVKNQKPKLVLLCVSGGGLRSAVWSLKVVQTADSLMGGKLLDHTVLITGASGGMLGMAYMRELYLRSKTGSQVDMYAPKHIEDLSSDMLNAIAFTIISNDLFLPWTRIERGGYSYYKDRGYIFEEQLNENTGGVLDKCLGDYAEAEREGRIPMLLLTPSIVNDGRRMIISPQGVSYMMSPPMGVRFPHALEVDAVDFGRVFKNQGASNLQFLTALRMNATYPYILPNVHMPSEPQIEVMDAGFRDNYGILSATRFVQVFRDWIMANTSGVVLVQINTSDRVETIKPSDRTGVVTSLTSPLDIAGKLFTLQEFEHDNSLGFVYDLLGPRRFEVIRFIYYPSSDTKLAASISFHLTAQEKEDVQNAIYLPENQQCLKDLEKALK